MRSWALALAAICSPIPAAQAAAPGAVVPWVTYEAEDAHTDAPRVGPDYRNQSPAREASARRFVQLNAANSLEFLATADANGIVVRYTLPDGAPDTRLNLSINRVPTTSLTLSTRLSHLYGPYPFTNDPAVGSARNFWDEARAISGPIRAGDTVRLELDSGAAECAIDFVELEQVDPALEKPAHAVSVTDFGAVSDDGIDDRPAFVAALAAARAGSKTVWIPAGRFVLKGPLEVAEMTLQGAGMWHSTLVGVDDYTPANRVSILGTGSNITLADFAIVGALNYRNDSEPNDGIGGSFGTSSTLRNLWIEHTKAGVWVVNSDALLVENCRFRNTIADGLNLCVGMRNSVVRNCTSRGTGDDGFAMWPATYMPAEYPHGGNQIIHCTAQLPFLAQGFSLYGGEGNRISDCLAIDIPYGAGLFASTTFPTESGFRGTTTLERSRIIRAGDREGALGFVANRVDLVGLSVQEIEIIDSPNDAVRFMSVNGRALRDATLDRIRIQNAGIAGSGYGIVAADDAVGSVALGEVVIAGSESIREVSPKFEMTYLSPPSPTTRETPR